MTEPFLGVYLQLEPALKASNAMKIARTAKEAGYNALCLWDSPHQFTPQDPDLNEKACKFAEGVRAEGLSLWLQVAHTGGRVRDALGNSIMETGTGEGDDMICLADYRIWPLWSEWIVRAQMIYGQIDGVLLNYDEPRAQGTHPACVRRAGHGLQLADHTREAIAMHRSLLPGAKVAVWSDSYSPYENARPGDYAGNFPDRKWLVKGGWSGSWHGLDEDALILNWSFDHQSFGWFRDQGHTQIYAGAYDWPNKWGDGIGPDAEKKQMDGLLTTDVRLAGYCYVTWQGDYSRLADYMPPPEIRQRMGG